MHPVERFIHNPVKVSAGVLLLVLFGLIAMARMPMQLVPGVDRPVIEVDTDWPGASPQEVEREITQEQEEQLRGVEGMKKMSSESRESESEIILEFAVGTSMPKALLEVSGRLDRVRQYPFEAEKPVIRTRDLSGRSVGIFVLRPRVAEAEEIAAFEREHPELSEVLEPARTAYTAGMRVRRLEAIAHEHPEVAALLPPPVDVPTYRRFAENVIEARLERVDRVSDARVLGGLHDELQVIVDPQRLAARQLTIMDIRRAVVGRNLNTSGGTIWEGKRQYAVRTLGQFGPVKQVADLIIARRDGAPVYVRDVAQVQIGFKKPDGLALRVGSASITIMCSREPNSNALEVMQGLRQAVVELNEGPLRMQGLSLEQVYDETDYIYSSIGLVRQNLLIGGLLTVGVLLLFLRSGRSTIVVGLAIPICVIGSFLVLYLLGRTLNVVSLAGLAFAIGMLVDNAVVVLENIYRHYQAGETPLTAAVRGTHEVWGAVVASTLTTLAVFLPVLFVQEEAGQLFRDIALAISAAVALSLIVSVTVIPTAAAKLLKNRTGGLDPRDVAQAYAGDAETAAVATDDVRTVRPVVVARRRSVARMLLGKIDALAGRFVSLVVATNAALQRSVMARLVTAIGLIGGALWLSWLLIPKVAYLPAGSRNLVFGVLSPPPGYNLRHLREIGEQIEADLRPYWDVDLESPEAAKLRYPPINDFFYIAHGREIFMGLRSVDPARASELIPLILEVTDEIPGMNVVANQSSIFERGRGGGRSLDVEITGPGIERLVALGQHVMSRVGEVMPLAQARPIPSLDLTNSELHVIPKWEQAADLQIAADELGYIVDALVDGAKADDYYVGGDKIDLSIIGQERFASRTQDIKDLAIATPTGQVVPLEAVAEVRLGSGPEQINHSGRQRAITISVSPPENMPMGEAMELIDGQIVAPMIADGQLDEEYQIHMAGAADRLLETWQALRWNVALAVVITYILMAALFESWLYPLVIILSVPMGAVGGFLGLNLLNLVLYAVNPNQRLQQLDVLTMLGFVILIGTVVNNAILIVHQALNHMRQGMPQRQAILESVRIRIRPIFMTTSTTVLGLSPLVVFPGAGSELYRGLGSVLLGGLAVSAAFTLLLVPTLFSLLMDAREWFLRRFDGGQAGVADDIRRPQRASVVEATSR